MSEEKQPYKPRAGSVAERVMQHCRARGKCSSTMLVNEIEDLERKALPACLSTAIAYEAIFVTKVKGENWYDVKPFEAGEEEEAPAEVVASVAAMPFPRQVASVEEEPAAALRPIESRFAEFTCALYSDGRFVLLLDGSASMVLSSEQSAELVRYVQHVRPREAIAA